MKRFICALVIGAALSVPAFAGPVNVYTYNDVTVSSYVPTLVSSISVERKWSLLVNVGEFAVRVATHAGGVSATKGIPVYSGGGHLEDAWYVHTSSMWAISSGTGPATVSYSEKR